MVDWPIIGFIVGLISVVIGIIEIIISSRKRGRKKYYERGSKEIIEEVITRYKKGRLVSRTKRRIVRKR